jgi:YebC/PmpR family DNA-binding regulatory protein
MAGHSHWAGIKHKKGRADKIRSKIFSKLSREITVAAKLGDKNPEMKPKDNIDRAVEKSQIGDSSSFESIRYEGFGPKNIAVIVETLTDNKNRTASSIRTLFQKNGGSLGTQGSSSHNFKQIGVIKINFNNISEERILEIALNAGALDCISIKGDFHEIHCEKENIYKVKKILEKDLDSFISTGIEWIPFVFIEVNQTEKEDIINFLENLEDDDDVQNVYSNVKFID